MVEQLKLARIGRKAEYEALFSDNAIPIEPASQQQDPRLLIGRDIVGASRSAAMMID